jgi:hypothetical protein
LQPLAFKQELSPPFVCRYPLVKLKNRSAAVLFLLFEINLALFLELSIHVCWPVLQLQTEAVRVDEQVA